MVLNKVTNSEHVSKKLKVNNLESYKKALEKEKNDSKDLSESKIKWNIVKQDDGTRKIDPMLENDHVNISSIRQIDKSISANVIAHKLGYKINLEEKIDILKDKYIKNYLQSKSHNYMVAKFAELKTSFLSQTLSNLGVSTKELSDMQKKALKNAQEENELLFEENEYNEEMIFIIGGSSKKIQKEISILAEIREQLIAQMNKLGKSNYYTETNILNKKLNACKKIQEELLKEKNNLQYQRDYYSINKNSVSAGKNAFERLNS
jgi:hypothetical protein